MYSEQDLNVINAKIRKNWLVLAPVLAVILAVYVYALYAGIEWLAMVAGPLLFVAACYGLLAYLLPNLRYRRFLTDLQTGLNRDLRGTVLAIGETAEPQDGAMVLPVRLRLEPDGAQAGAAESVAARRLGAESAEDTRDERIVYLNKSKRDQFPGVGTRVLLHCFGRHIRSVECDEQR